MHRKYKDLGRENAKEWAELVGKVRKENYLAHSIREIEYAFLRLKGFNYHILTYVGETKKSKAMFYSKGCQIRLPRECEEIDDKVIRLTLAHELGHLIYNFHLLDNPEILMTQKTSNDEETFAWEFAYYLIAEKSKMFSDTNAYQQFAYKDAELKRTVRSLIDKKPEPIKASVINKLRLPKD
jgi:hypothetical protein